MGHPDLLCLGRLAVHLPDSGASVASSWTRQQDGLELRIMPLLQDKGFSRALWGGHVSFFPSWAPAAPAAGAFFFKEPAASAA